MSKEYSESLGKNIRYKKEYIGNDTYRLYIKKNDIELLENYLEQEQIKNANPSEALKELEQNIKGRVILAEDRQLKLCAVIKQALLKAQEQEKEIDRLENQCLDILGDNIRFKKVLEIIKRVYTDLCFILSFDTFEEYNRSCDLISVKANLKRVNKEEFDLLKRWSNGK